jgi:hypothetical protein
MGIARGATTNPTASPSRAGKGGGSRAGVDELVQRQGQRVRVAHGRTGGRVEITGLLTTVTAATDSVVPPGAMTLGAPAHIRPNYQVPEGSTLATVEKYLANLARYRTELRRVD